MKLLLLSFCLVELVLSSSFVLEEEWKPESMLDHFNFYTGEDPTHGTEEYVSKERAMELGLIQTSSESLRLSVDDKSIIPPTSGRPALRLESFRNISSGNLLTFDLFHVPTGCSLWPALWLCGQDWPNQGEIDIFETVNVNMFTQTTLHTSGTCDQSKTADFTGKWATGTDQKTPATDCWVNAPGQYANEGCGIIAQTGTAGDLFNLRKGGMFVVYWSNKLQQIQIWFWKRGTIPQDLVNNHPNPDNWGLPYARFVFTDSTCKPSYFGPQTIVINSCLCGDWAGSEFGTDCPNLGECSSFVRSNPAAFSEAFWDIGSIKIFNEKNQ